MILEQAQKFADAGHVEIALNHCHDYLQRDSSNAEAHTLLGILHQTKANYIKAEQCFRKALYLNPYHYEDTNAPRPFKRISRRYCRCINSSSANSKVKINLLASSLLRISVASVISVTLIEFIYCNTVS
ncbi:MAG: hypothetical protein HC908_07955 [Calothrix sp. SM1_7_51]|nr:hypothetical protein [Calothrix sp. SM1_7_51]